MTDDLTLADLDVDEQIPEHRSVKEVVLPFDRRRDRTRGSARR